MSKNNELKSTIQPPETSFEMKADVPQSELQLLDRWIELEIYGIGVRRAGRAREIVSGTESP